MLVSHTKGARVAVNAITGKLTFRPEQGHFGHFTVVIKQGNKKMTFRFTVTKPKVATERPIVKVTKPHGSKTVVIVIVPPPGPPPPVNLSPPELRGNPVVGGTIRLTYGTWSGSTSQTGTYYDCDAQGQHCSVDPSQPEGDLYVVQSSDIGHSILLAETATGPGGTTTVDSRQTAVVTQPPPPLLISPPVLSGTPMLGQTLTLTYGTWRNSTSQSGVYYDCNSVGQACTVDAFQPQGDQYQIQPADVGHSILLAETAVGPGGSTTVDSRPTAVVTQPPPPLLISPPVLSGTPMLGQTLTLTYGTWRNSTSQSGVYYDCNSVGQACTVDAFQPQGDQYQIQPADVGHSILLAETAVGPGGSATVNSNATPVITPAAP